MSLKGLIFDLEGVIVFTDQYHYKAWKQMADEKGIYFDQEINNRLRGVSRMDSLEIILERYEGHPLSDEDKQKMAEEKNDIMDKFDAVSDGTNITRSKPDPEVFLKAAEFLSLKPEECGVVEDAYAGIDAAVSGHMTAIAIGDAAGYDKADYKLSTFKDLLDIAK